MMLLYLRKSSAFLLLVGVLAAITGGCQPPWESDEVVLDVPRVDPAKVQQDAIIVLQHAAEDDVATTRFIALEVIPAALGARGGAICKQALDDPSPEVRTAAAMGLGDLRYSAAKEKLQRMAKYKVQGAEPDARTYCAVLYALHRLGDEARTTNLGTLLFDREKEVRAAAAIVMGRMKLRAAISPLKSAIVDERDHDLKFELTRALARCGDKGSMRRIEAHTRDRFVDEQIIAVRAMQELESPMCRAIFSSLVIKDRSPRVKIVAAGALASFGYETPELFTMCVRAAMEPRAVMSEALGGGQRPTDKQVNFLQSLAATAAGEFKHPQALDVVAGLLKSSDPGVRVAAAAAILKAVPQLARPPAVSKKKVVPVSPARTKPAIKRPKLHTAGGKD
ncbi:MAG: HEAT repeat domain-containing protein [Phycisphaerae bacterium]|jgi:HEAT repeat protein|nr:HEAT repeat domain-containing protein [Phycisphaerae bacterium]